MDWHGGLPQRELLDGGEAADLIGEERGDRLSAVEAQLDPLCDAHGFSCRRGDERGQGVGG